MVAVYLWLFVVLLLVLLCFCRTCFWLAFAGWVTCLTVAVNSVVHAAFLLRFIVLGFIVLVVYFVDCVWVWMFISLDC